MTNILLFYICQELYSEMLWWFVAGFWSLAAGFDNIAGAVSFYRHARAGGHPVFPVNISGFPPSRE
jgi:hypothetical protein